MCPLMRNLHEQEGALLPSVSMVSVAIGTYNKSGGQKVLQHRLTNGTKGFWAAAPLGQICSVAAGGI